MSKHHGLKTSALQQRKRKPGGRPFQKGQSGNPAGRPKGIPNKATVEAKTFFGRILSDPIYQLNLIERLRQGDANAAIEAMAWHYWAGKPKETIALDKTSIEALVEAASKLGDPGRDPVE